MAVLKSELILSLRDEVSKVAARIDGSLGRLTKRGEKLGRFGRQATFGVTAPIAGVAGSIVKTALSFEKAKNNLTATMFAGQKEITEENRKTINLISSDAKELGRVTQFTATQIEEAFNFAAMAGVTNVKSLRGMMPALLDMAAATGMSIETLTDKATNAVSGFGLSQTEENLRRVGDLAAYTATRANTSSSQMFYAFKDAAPMARLLHMEIEELGAVLGVMGNGGFQGAEAGRALRTGILRLAAPTKKALGAFAALNINLDDYITLSKGFNGTGLAKQLGSDFGVSEDEAQKVKQVWDEAFSQDLDFSQTRQALTAGISEVLGQTTASDKRVIGEAIEGYLKAGIKEVDVLPLFDALREKGASASSIEAIFGKNRAAPMASIVSGSKDEKGNLVTYNDLLKDIKGNADGATKRMADLRMGGIVGEVKELQSAFEGAQLAIAESGLIEHLSKITTAGTETLRSLAETNPEWLKFGTNVALVGAALGPAAWAAGSMIKGIAGIGSALRAASVFAIGNPILAIAAAAVAAGAAFYAMRDEHHHAKLAAEKHSEILKQVKERFYGAAKGADTLTKSMAATNSLEAKRQLVDLRKEFRSLKEEAFSNLTDAVTSSTFDFNYDDIQDQNTKERLAPQVAGLKSGSVSPEQLAQALDQERTKLLNSARLTTDHYNTRHHAEEDLAVLESMMETVEVLEATKLAIAETESIANQEIQAPQKTDGAAPVASPYDNPPSRAATAEAASIPGRGDALNHAREQLKLASEVQQQAMSQSHAKAASELNEIAQKYDGLGEGANEAARKAASAGEQIRAALDVQVRPEIDTSSITQASNQVQRLGSAIRDLPGAKVSGQTASIAGARAAGGPVVGGKTYLVGEEGAELFSPSRSGYIHPAGDTGRALSQSASGNGVSVTFGDIVIHGAQDADTIARQIGQKLNDALSGIQADTEWAIS